MAESVPDYYAVLGVTRRDTHENIRRAYRRLARQVHPDTNPRHRHLPPGAPDIRMVNEAWDVLGDPHRRAVYDRATREAESPEEEDPAEARLPPVPQGFLLHPRPTWIGWGPSRRSSEHFNPSYHWRSRAADRYRGALSLAAEGRDLSNLSQLGEEDLWLLDVRGLAVTDADLRAVTRFRRLEVLLLDGSRVTDGGLHALRVLPSLRVLSLIHCWVTDDGLPAMLTLAGLEELILYGTAVTDEGLAVLAGHPRLTVLDIRKTRVRGEGIRDLIGMPALRELRVTGWADRAARRIFARRREVLIL